MYYNEQGHPQAGFVFMNLCPGILSSKLRFHSLCSKPCLWVSDVVGRLVFTFSIFFRIYENNSQSIVQLIQVQNLL